MKPVKKFETNYVLIDFENVQPKNLSSLTGDYFKVYLFMGAQQTRINVALADAMHDLGPNRSQYIRVAQTGPNALDFHVTFYLGSLTALNPEAYFHVISKDKGYDPLVEYLKSQGINVCRRASLADIPILNIDKESHLDQKFDAVVKNLIGRGLSKPRKDTTLKNTIKSMFKDDLKESEMSALLQKLTSLKYITSINGNITYSLPK